MMTLHRLLYSDGRYWVNVCLLLQRTWMKWGSRPTGQAWNWGCFRRNYVVSCSYLTVVSCVTVIWTETVIYRIYISLVWLLFTASWRITFLPATNILIHIWMLTHIHTSHSRCVLWPEINMCDARFQSHIYYIWRHLLHCFTCAPPVQWCFYPTKMGLYIQKNRFIHKAVYISLSSLPLPSPPLPLSPSPPLPLSPSLFSPSASLPLSLSFPHSSQCFMSI